MRFLALATDYDGTIATDGRMSPATVAAIERLRMSGRRVLLVTGRRVSDLVTVCPHLLLFDYVVAENGALVYEPRTRESTLLAKAPPPEFSRRLAALGVEPLEVGEVIVATWTPHQNAVIQAIQELGLELQLIFNRTAIMVLPAGVNKATGLYFALRKLGLSPHEVVSVGDSENDHSLFDLSACSVAVANAVPSIRAAATFVTKGEEGQGVAELIGELIANDLSCRQGHLSQHFVPIGEREDGTEVTAPPYGINILIAGPSGSGKSTVAAGLVERLVDRDYQLCIVDPEGDYGTLHGIITLGNQNHAVTVNEALALLEDPKVTLNVNLLGIPLADRPAFFSQLFPNLQAMRARTGRPHWIVLDEAHHMLPADRMYFDRVLPQRLGETILVTVHPDHLAPEVLNLVDVVIAVGPAPDRTMQKFANAAGHTLAWPDGLTHRRQQAVVWFPHHGGAPYAIHVIQGRAERIRHHRKYAEGNMRYRSFFFRGPDNRHNLRAQNLSMFSQIAEGIDEETWMFHLRRGDYASWFRGSVKDSYLADQAERVANRMDLTPAQTRTLIRSLIEARYTLPE